jgi:pimeloyl-ACP methyl ester carboxylesterase
MTAATRTEINGPVGRIVAYDTGEPGGGAALPVVLVHGINMSAAVWDRLVDRLARERRVVTMDLRGHGASVMTGPYDAAGYAGDVVAVMDALGIPRAHLVGTSFGGPVVATIAAEAPDRVASITAIGSAVSAEGAVDVEAGIAMLREVGPLDFFRGFMGQASFAPGTDPALIEEAAQQAGGRDVDVIADVVRVAFSADASDAVGNVRAPALVITGEHDMTCPVPAGEQLASALGTTLVVLPDRGHMAMVEDADAVAGAVGPHLAAHDAA